MKVWCIPVNFPNPEKEPEQAEAATRFLRSMQGITGFCPVKGGMVALVFQTLENARAAKWKMEEFTDVSIPIIEGAISKDGKTRKRAFSKYTFASS